VRAHAPSDRDAQAAVDDDEAPSFDGSLGIGQFIGIEDAIDCGVADRMDPHRQP